jgi:hypothetical protein
MGQVGMDENTPVSTWNVFTQSPVNGMLSEVWLFVYFKVII